MNSSFSFHEKHINIPLYIDEESFMTCQASRATHRPCIELIFENGYSLQLPLLATVRGLKMGILRPKTFKFIHCENIPVTKELYTWVLTQVLPSLDSKLDPFILTVVLTTLRPYLTPISLHQQEF